MATEDARPQPALVVIDMQEAFRDPDRGWAVVGYADAEQKIADLVAHFPGRVVWTRFVRDAAETGAWTDYYDRWSAFRVGADDQLWDLTSPSGPQDAVVTLPTFSKWGAELADVVGPQTPLVVCGVATDCCVLSTVLGAVDAGHPVTVVTDACAGATQQAHDQALALMGLLAPMITLADTDRVLQSGSAAAVERA